MTYVTPDTPIGNLGGEVLRLNVGQRMPRGLLHQG